MGRPGPDRPVAQLSPYLLQGGLGMPDRDYYISATPHMAELRKQYQAHVARDVQARGLRRTPAATRRPRLRARDEDGARARHARRVGGCASAAISWKRDELAAKAPGLDWPALLDAAGLEGRARLHGLAPEGGPGLAALAASEPLDAWKDWLAFHAVDQAAASCRRRSSTSASASTARRSAEFPSCAPRWKRGVDSTNAALGDAVGKLYVERYFPPETKAKAQAMVQRSGEGVRQTDRRARLDVARDQGQGESRSSRRSTSASAIPTAGATTRASRSSQGDALGNAQRAELFEYRRQLAKLDQPVDRTSGG